jgi:glycine/D-amino acid oxidase-like deaminating enzyme
LSAPQHVGALADAKPQAFWLDDPDRPAPLDPLAENSSCDLAIVGGGFSGLWTALLAKERDPDRRVVLLEGERIGWAASGRNGGFCEYSLTHGLANGITRFPGEIRTLVRLGLENLEAMQDTVGRYGIDCGWERTGELNVATQPWQVADLREHAETAGKYGEEQEFLDTDAVRAQVNSPTYLAGIWDRQGCAMLNPAKLAWGLRDACLELGVQIFEGTPVTGLRKEPAGLVLRTESGRAVTADRVALATNVFRPLIRRVRPYLAPVYDYALMTEPLTAEQLASIGWRNRQGLADWSNLYHYYRLTEDNRILWGGYDVVYHYGNRIAPGFDQRPETFATLAEHFFTTFPQLAGVRFSHTWGGVIDVCARFSAFFGTAHQGRVAYAAGFTGLGVGATRFGANVMLDLVSGLATELTELKMVRDKPLPFPPEPLRSVGVKLTRWSMERADANEGKRNLFLRAMDAVGLGFDS